MRLAILLLTVAVLSGCTTSTSLPHLKVEAVMPAPIEIGGPGQLVLRVRNEGVEALTVKDVDLSRGLLAGVKVESVTPWTQAAATELRDYAVYRLDLEVPARGEKTVNFRLAGTKAGTHVGDVDVCLDNFHFVTQKVALLVYDPAASPEETAAVAPSEPAPAVAPSSAPEVAPTTVPEPAPLAAPEVAATTASDAAPTSEPPGHVADGPGRSADAPGHAADGPGWQPAPRERVAPAAPDNAVSPAGPPAGPSARGAGSRPDPASPTGDRRAPRP